MAAISDSSPLNVYSGAGRFDLLRAVFEHLYVPPAVWSEVVEQGRGRPGVDTVSRASWISIRPPGDNELAKLLRQTLDFGEAEAIALALELPPGLPVLIDDLIGRRIARGLGIETVGSAGVLLRAKDYGIISHVRPMLEELRNAGLFIGSSAVKEVLQLANEE